MTNWTKPESLEIAEIVQNIYLKMLSDWGLPRMDYFGESESFDL